MFYTIILSALLSLTCLSPQDTLANGVEKQVIATLKQGPDSIGRGLRAFGTPELEAVKVADSLIAYAREFLGTPYKYGANGPNSFDCTGFAGYVYRRFGVDHLSRSSIGMAHDGREVEGDLTNLQKGDIVIFGSRHAPAIVGHVGIFIALDSSGRDFTFIHAANSGVTVSRLSETYYVKRFKGARRVLPDFNGADREAGRVLQALKDSLLLASVTDSAAALPMIPKVDSTFAGTEQADVQAAADTAVYYVIKKGDNLSKIALRNHTTVRKICDLNGITAKTVLKIGRRLRIK